MTPENTPAAPIPDRELAVAGVVHDVNQLLTVIAGRAELLKLRSQARPGDLEAIGLAVRDAAAMLRRLTAGAAPGGPAAADLRRCVEEVGLVHQPPSVRGWEPAAGPGAWRLDNRVPEGLAAALPAQVVREVLGNLVVNALEAMDQGGTLTVTAEGTADGPDRLCVRDTGPGLAESDRERIFAVGWSTRDGAARGVGLAASRQLLAAWGGTLDAGEPDPGGAVFTLELPAATVTAAAGPLPGETPAGPVLVVDDEPAVRDVLAEFLAARGLEVVVAGDATAARDLCRPGRFAVALVDVTLPGESGLDLVRDLRRRDPALATVLMTGVDRVTGLPAEAAAGADAVTTKPLDFAGLPGLLAAAVAAAARRRSHDASEEG